MKRLLSLVVRFVAVVSLGNVQGKVIGNEFWMSENKESVLEIGSTAKSTPKSIAKSTPKSMPKSIPEPAPEPGPKSTAGSPSCHFNLGKWCEQLALSEGNKDNVCRQFNKECKKQGDAASADAPNTSSTGGAFSAEDMPKAAKCVVGNPTPFNVFDHIKGVCTAEPEGEPGSDAEPEQEDNLENNSNGGSSSGGSAHDHKSCDS